MQKLGFSDKEARVYVALLELEQATVSDVSKKAKTNRSTTYVVLEQLVKQGLLSTTEEKNVRVYIATPPERLIQLLEERVKKDAERVTIAHTLLPELKSVYSGSGPKPKIRYYEGSEGLTSVYEDTLTSHETIRSFASIEDVHAALPHYFPEYYVRRVAKQIHVRGIFPDTDGGRERASRDREEYRETRVVPKEEYPFSSEVNIYDNKIVFMSLKEKFGFIIESKELSDTMKKVFELSWHEAERLHKNRKKK